MIWNLPTFDFFLALGLRLNILYLRSMTHRYLKPLRSRRQIFTALLFLILSTSISCSKPEKIEEEPPNIILIIADDMNWDDAGVYGHPSIQTANIDRLAKEGLRYDHAYLTTSSCSPSRASIITSRYPHNTGAEQLHWAIPRGSQTFVQLLQQSGYYTAAAGKWHMGDHIRAHFDTIIEASVSGFQLPTGDDSTPAKMIAKKPSGCEDWLPVLKNRPRDQPFFMWFAALDPHRAYDEGALENPHKIEDVLVPPYLPDVEAVRQDLRLYYDEIGRLDQYVGLVMDELTAQGIDDNTLIVFISDNGRPFPRDKTTLYDGGIKTPFIVKWPNKVAPGIISSSLISTVDIGPTLLQSAGIEAPNDFEGTSFLSTFSDPKTKVRDYAFGEDHWHDYEDHARCIVNQRWKLIRNDYVDLPATPSADAGRGLAWQAMLQLKEEKKLSKPQLACFDVPRAPYELYDLKNDPYELNNLANDSNHKEVLNQLISALDQWSVTTNDFLPTKRTPDEFDRVTGEPDHSVRKRPRPDKKAMFGTYGAY